MLTLNSPIKQGTLLRLMRGRDGGWGMGAKKGAIAKAYRVNANKPITYPSSPHSSPHSPQVQVEWLHDTPEHSDLSQNQCDGGYNLDQFDLVQCSEVERRGDGAKG